jgi:hypothetical protein
VNVKSIIGALRPGAVLLGLLLASQSHADSVTGREDWSFLAEVYLWGPDIDIENAEGEHQEVEFSDLADITRGGFMGGGYAQRGKWRFGIDAIYLDADERVGAKVEPGVELKKINLEVWYASPTVAYEVARFEGSEFYAYVGARYLWAEPTVKVKTSDPLPSGGFETRDNDGVWDGFVGLHGTTRLSERWYLAYQADIGAGDSDAVYQALAGINYRFTHVDITGGYRWMRWDLDTSLFNELEFNGFYLGGKIFF